MRGAIPQIPQYASMACCSVKSTWTILVHLHPEGKRSLEVLRCKWGDNIRKDLTVIGWEVVELIHVAQKRDQKGLL
jgi:hypothetical protein